MLKTNKIIVGKDGTDEYGILIDKANRHGFITGATGSGKTITAKVLAEGFSDAGIPVFIADVKGDIESTFAEGEINDNIQKRLTDLKIDDFETKSFPTVIWDIYGESGHPVRASVQDIGPEVLSMMMGLSEVQEGVLNSIFKICEDEGLGLYNLADLKVALAYINEHKKEYVEYGNITTPSIGVIQRSLLILEKQGANKFFSMPTLDIKDLMNTTDGMGNINILHAVKLFENPDLYASWLLWFFNELYTKSSEVGDNNLKLVFFFDESHLLFKGLPEYRLKRIVQTVKLMRSKGIGLYFISQNPTDIPDDILNQLGNRIQHTLRAYTPGEQRVVNAAADAFRENKKINTKDAILNLGTGEGLVSFQNEAGEPEIVHQVTVLPCKSRIGTLSEMEINKCVNNSPFAGKYDEEIDPESACEILTLRKQEEEKIKQEELEKELEEKEQKKKDAANPFTKKKIATKVGNTAINTVTRRVVNSFMKNLTKNLFK